MPDIPSKNDLLKTLEPFGQEHLLMFWEQLNDAERRHLGAQIQSVDWAQVSQWLAAVLPAGGASAVPFERLEPAPYMPLQPQDSIQRRQLQEARAHGEELLRAGRVGCFTVAGGQGTRLGYNGPKGTYCFSPLRNASLFEYFALAIQCNQRKYGTILPWYIMCSPANLADTVEFFLQHKYFGLAADNVRFFEQGTLPGFDRDGKALLQTPGDLTSFANGHGGALAAIHDSGTLDDMKRRGIDFLSYWQVDNPLVATADPLFLGLHALTGSEMSSRALIKRDAKEKLGHFCRLDGRTVIIEYSDMPDPLLQRRDPDGRLTFRAGSPAIHVLSRSFIERLTHGGTLHLQPHRADKKISHVDRHGVQIIPDAPNGIKLEFFIFDALPLAQNPLILEADRAEQFAAIKNAFGQDSPDSCRAALADRTAKWLEAVGVHVPRTPDGALDATIEISPRLATAPEDLLPLVKNGRLPIEIPSGAKICLD